MVTREARLLRSQIEEFRARMAALDGEIARRQAEIGSTRELVAKMEEIRGGWLTGVQIHDFT
jgi:prefoldin subunit 5